MAVLLSTDESSLPFSLHGSWGWLAFRGVLAILFSIMTIAWPFESILALAWVWGVFAIADGTFALIAGWKMRAMNTRVWPYVLGGLLGIVAGIVAVAYPGLTAVVFLTILGVWAVIGGIFQIATYFRLKDATDGSWMPLVTGIISVLFGLMVFFRPIEGLLAIIWVIGFFSFISGVLFISLALKARNH